MAKYSKRMEAIRAKLGDKRIYTLPEAVSLLKELVSHDETKLNFAESVDLAVNLGVDPRKHMVRGAVVLPHGTGSQVRVAVFAQGANADKARAAGADIVGYEDLVDQIKAGNMDFDVAIASPDTMAKVGQLGQILGPRGLMPNPKVGTVTTDVAKAITDAKAGQVRYRIDKGGTVHCKIGNATLDEKALVDNVNAMISDIKKVKPSAAKGVYIKKVILSTTMGCGLVLESSSIAA